MSEASLIVHECRGCGEAIEPGEDYVVAREYVLAPDFSLHMKGDEGTAGETRRFHVHHFRGRLGDHVYELVDERSSQ
jgi:hypothetical protein